MERANTFPQVPLLRDGGDWAPIQSSVHLLMSHHTCLWALGLHVCNQDHIRSCDDSACREKYFVFDCKTAVALEHFFIHLFWSVYKTLIVKVLTIISVGAWFSLLLGTLTILLLLCILNTLITFVSLRKYQINLQMVIQEYYLSAPRIPSLALWTWSGLPWLWCFREKIHLSSREHILTALELSFWIIVKNLLFDSRIRSSCFHIAIFQKLFLALTLANRSIKS